MPDFHDYERGDPYTGYIPTQAQADVLGFAIPEEGIWESTRVTNMQVGSIPAGSQLYGTWAARGYANMLEPRGGGYDPLQDFGPNPPPDAVLAIAPILEEAEDDLLNEDMEDYQIMEAGLGAGILVGGLAALVKWMLSSFGKRALFAILTTLGVKALTGESPKLAMYYRGRLLGLVDAPLAKDVARVARGGMTFLSTTGSSRRLITRR